MDMLHSKQRLLEGKMVRDSNNYIKVDDQKDIKQFAVRTAIFHSDARATLASGLQYKIVPIIYPEMFLETVDKKITKLQELKCPIFLFTIVTGNHT